jgi:hypothetical protein
VHLAENLCYASDGMPEQRDSLHNRISNIFHHAVLRSEAYGLIHASFVQGMTDEQSSYISWNKRVFVFLKD